MQKNETHPCHGSGKNHSTMDSARGAVLPLATGFRLRASESRGDCSAMSWGDWYMCQQKMSEGASLREEKACPDCPMTKNRPEMGLERLVELSTISNGCTELVAMGWTDTAIADELEDYISHTPRFGERPLTKYTIAAIRRSWFPREFAPGCGHGTIETPSGELVEGKHPAAWPYELWQRMIEVKASQYRRPRKEAQKRPHEFSRIIVCAACQRHLRVSFGSKGLPYYRDTSLERKLPCPTTGSLSVRSALVMQQFGEVLRSVELPTTWREAIAEQCKAAASAEGGEHNRVQKRRAELDAEQKRLINVYTKGYITEQELDEKVERIRSEQFTLPFLQVKDTEKITKELYSTGETLEHMADYWNEATAEERRDIVWSLLNAEGLVYDLERQIIIGLKPRASVLPVLALGLEATLMWEQREDGLWLREDYWPPKREVEKGRPGRPPTLTPAQQERAIMLIRQGMPLQQVAELLETSYDVVYRLAKSEGIELPRAERKLTPEQLREAYGLLGADVPFRHVAKRFGINPESLRRLAERDGVKLKAREEKLTLTKRKLTPEQQQEARDLVRSGVSLRQTARMFGISRQALSLERWRR